MNNIENKEIINLRNDLDLLDAQIIELLMRRFSITQQIGKLKKTLQIEVTDQIREQQILSRIENIVRTLNKCDDCTNQIESMCQIYKIIMAESRRQQNIL